MTEPREHLLLKWRTLKGWKLESEVSKAAFKAFAGDGITFACMSDHLTTEQKKLLCDLIDVVDGEIRNDWSGETMTKDEAKAYVMGSNQ